MGESENVNGNVSESDRGKKSENENVNENDRAKRKRVEGVDSEEWKRQKKKSERQGERRRGCLQSVGGCERVQE